jgi:glycosyltransferase involved in cell wall biosynthesis
MRVSVILPTHNPRPDYFRRVLEALGRQTLPADEWEVVVVDNASRDDVHALAAHVRLRRFRVVREEKLGLTSARLRGFAEGEGEWFVLVDDDNVLARDYLECALGIAGRHPALGVFGGRVLPVFESAPPSWIEGVWSGLGCRDLGGAEILWPPLASERGAAGRVGEFPRCAPIGAGMVLRREAAAAYADLLRSRAVEISDRKGDSLSSAGDNDICLCALEQGWQAGYFPQLEIRHLIPRARTTLDYQNRMAREAMRSFVVMLDLHGIRPWPRVPGWTVPLRVSRDWFRVRPWRDEGSSLRWAMNRGRYEGCSQIGSRPPSVES